MKMQAVVRRINDLCLDAVKDGIPVNRAAEFYCVPLDKKYKFPLLYILLEKYGNTVDELSPYFQLHYAYGNVKHYHYKHNCYGNVEVYHHFWMWLY